jgi:peptidoglycan hydrolase CwlO-like protein
LVSEQGLIIERLKYLNLEVSTGKIIKTKENIDIRCRINPSEEHTWHTAHSQLNIVVDLIYNFFLTWGKRQEILDQKLESLFKEYQKLTEKYSSLNNKIDIVLHKLEEAKARHNTVNRNNGYIKEEVQSIGKSIGHCLNKNKEILSNTKTRQDIIEIKRVVKEVKKLILS